MLRLQCSHQASAVLLLFAVDFFLCTHLNIGEHRHRLNFDALEHRGKELEGLAFIFEAVVLLRVAT